ncbi:MAG: hypothetical protein M0Z60_02980 [Nitrospiraceae bacterium]|nr:hypothetical protein [Nitrospiraceae bacterium]
MFLAIMRKSEAISILADAAQKASVRAIIQAPGWRGKPAGVLIGFEDEEDWFDYRLENDARFLKRIEQARRSIKSGMGSKNRRYLSRANCSTRLAISAVWIAFFLSQLQSYSLLLRKET